MICRRCLEDADEGKWALGEVEAFDLSVSTEFRPVIRTQKHRYTLVVISKHAEIHKSTDVIIHTKRQRDAQTYSHAQTQGVCFFLSIFYRPDVLISRLYCCTPSGH